MQFFERFIDVKDYTLLFDSERLNHIGIPSLQNNEQAFSIIIIQPFHEKMKSKSRLITQEQAIRKLINVDISKVIKEMAAYFEQERNFYLANKFRAKPPGR
jgi:hypothetical protein